MTGSAVGVRGMRELTSPEELLAASGGDDFVRCEGVPHVGRSRAWAPIPPGDEQGAAGAVAFTRRRPDGESGWLAAVGDPATAAALLVEVVDTLGVLPRGLTVPRAVVPLLPEQLRPVGGSDWDWFRTRAAPPEQPGEDRVAWLDASDEWGLRDLLGAASPRSSAQPGGPGVLRWCGVRDQRERTGGSENVRHGRGEVGVRQGRLLACAVHTEHAPDVPHLASIATQPDTRGRGLGAAVTAWLTRTLLAEGHGVVTLGMYADNDVARRLYHRLGYRSDHAFTSGRLASPPSVT